LSLDFWRHRNSSRQQVCVQPHSTVNVTLPAFGTERRAAAPLPLSAGACYRSISPVLTALDQQTRRTPVLLSIDGTDGRTDARPFHRPCSAYYAGSVNNVGAKFWPFFLFRQFSDVFLWVHVSLSRPAASRSVHPFSQRSAECSAPPYTQTCGLRKVRRQ